MPRLKAIMMLGLIAAPASAQHAAHVHGSGSLKLAVEGDHLMVELAAPAHDIVGFEHMPGDDDQRAAVVNARKLLSDGAALLGLPAAANCRQETVKVESALLEDNHAHDEKHGDSHAKDGEHKDDDHAHGAAKEDDHAHGEKDKDDHAHGHKHGDDDAHSEFRVTYAFDCGDPSELSGLSPTYFKLFPRAEVLDVQAITDAGQISVELTPDAPNLTLPGS